MKRILFTAALLLACAALPAQTKEWANYSRYSEQNEQVLQAQSQGAPKPLAVLMGDSITDGWYRADRQFFEDFNLVGRGISGQCTSQMLARFQRDVVELKPKYVVILAGTNDIALNEGFSNVENAFRNIISMCQIAKANGIKVILCSTTPAAGFPWRPEVTDANAQERWLNETLKEYAAAHRLGFADYAAALSRADGVTDPAYSHDGVHPNIDGYKIMEGILLDALRIRKR